MMQDERPPRLLAPRRQRLVEHRRGRPPSCRAAAPMTRVRSPPASKAAACTGPPSLAARRSRANSAAVW